MICVSGCSNISYLWQIVNLTMCLFAVTLCNSDKL